VPSSRYTAHPTVAVALLLTVLPACRTTPEPAPAQRRWLPDSVPFESDPAKPATDGQTPVPRTQLSVSFQLLRVELPLGAVSDSQKLWNHVDEEALGSDQAMFLRQNGFRIGLGQPAAWPAVQAILVASHPTLAKRKAISLQTAYPLAIEDGQPKRDQTIFYYRPDGTLVGQSVDQSRNVLRIDHQIDPQGADAVLLHVLPEIRRRDTGLQMLRTQDGIKQLPAYEGVSIRDLSFTIRVPDGWFLVIAAGPRVSQTGLIGREFMSCAGHDGRYEFVYVIWPTITRSLLEPPPTGSDM